MQVLLIPLIFIFAYLLGAVNFAAIVTKVVLGIDIRTLGNRNPGAANVSRSVGFGYGVAVIFLDFAKGYLPMYLARTLVFPEATATAYFATLAAGLLAILGHCVPIYYGFKGGRGIATSLAVYIFFVPGELVISALVAALVVWLFVRNVRFRVGRWIPIVFVTLTPFTVLITSVWLDTARLTRGFVGGRPWFVIVGTLITSLFILAINLVFTGRALSELAGKAPDWDE